MAIDVETLLVKLEARITDFEKKMSAAERRADGAAKKIQRSFSAVPGAVNKALGLIGAGFSARALLGIISSGIDAGQAIGDLSEKLGISAQALQEFGFVAEQNGASIDDIEASFRGLTKFLGAASKGTKEQTNLLGQLGLSFDQLRNKRPEEIFTTLLDRIGKIANPLQRNASLMQVFGKAGTSLAQVAQLGAKNIDELRAKAESLGLVMSNETVKALQDAGDKVDLLNRLWIAGKGAIATAFLPALNDLVGFLTSKTFQGAFSDFIGTIKKEVAQDIKDFNGLITLANTVLANLRSAVAGNLSATDQPHPEKGGDAVIQRRGALIDRIGDAAEGAAGSTQHLTTAMVENSKSFKAAQAKALGLTDTYDTLGGVTDEQAKAQDKAAAAAERAAKKYDDEAKKLTFEGDQLTRTTREQAIYNAVNDAGADISTAAGRSIADQAAANFDLAEAVERSTERMDLFRDAARTGLGTFVSDLREGKSVLEALGDALDRITDRLVDFGLDQLMNVLLGKPGTTGTGIFSSLAGKASGGSVSANTPIRVGERGEEVFVPRTAGVIGTARGGSGIKVETHYHNNASVKVRESQQRTDSGVRLDVMIDEIVASKGRDPSSKTSRMLAQRGATTQSIRR